mgnify:CR=1 FL=1
MSHTQRIARIAFRLAAILTFIALWGFCGWLQ